MSTPGNVQTERYQLFQRAGSTKWQVRFSIKGQGQFKRSLDTDDLREAERRLTPSVRGHLPRKQG